MVKKSAAASLLAFVVGVLVITSGNGDWMWVEDFDGEALDPARWVAIEAGGGFGNDELQYYRSANAVISGGTLKLHARRELYQQHNYTSAKLVTTGAWRYCLVSIRARFTAAPGTWPAMWMMPSRFAYGAWPRSGEIDIMESVGYNASYVFASLNTGAFNQFLGTHQGGQTRVNGQDWHIYTLNWLPERLDFGVDGRVYYSFAKRPPPPPPTPSSSPLRSSPSMPTIETWPFDQHFYLILNLAVGGRWGGRGGVDEAAFGGLGQVLEVDWIRIAAPSSVKDFVEDQGGKELKTSAASGAASGSVV
jgi:beta-glucanase (GH16 family)